MAKRLWRWACFSLKREMKKKELWVLMCFFAVVGYLLITVTAPGQNRRLVVLHTAEKSGLSPAVVKALEEKESVFIFREAKSEDEARQLVERMEADCGFLFPADFTENVEKGERVKIATYLSHPASLMGPAAKELVFEAFFREYSKTLLTDIVKGGKFFSRGSDALAEEVLRYNEKYQGDAYAYSFRYETEGKSGYETGSDTAGKLGDLELPELEDDGAASKAGVQDDASRPVFATVAFLMCLATILIYGGTKEEKGIYLKVRRAEKPLYRLVELCAGTVPLTLLGAAALIFGGAGPKTAIGLLMLPAYAVLCSLWVMAIGALSKNAVSFYGLVPVTVICLLLLSDCFVNIGEIIPAMNGIKWLFPPTYYMIGF